LPEEVLRRPVLPSGWTCLGLVRHLALDVERFWFQAVVAGATVELETGAGAWQVGPDTPAETIFELYRAECRPAAEIGRATGLDTPPAWWPPAMGPVGFDDLRQVLLHVIAETACHAGHLDAVRELIDSRQWMVLT